METLTISLDLDSVLADTIHLYVDMYQREHGGFITSKDHITGWNLNRFFTGIDTYKYFVKVWQNWKNLRTCEPDTDLDVRYLGETLKHNIMILTSQQKETMPYILEWLKANNIPHDCLCFVPHMKDKVKFPADIYIDDYPYLAMYLPDGKKQFLYTQPWNIDVPEGPKVQRIETLDDAIKILAK